MVLLGMHWVQQEECIDLSYFHTETAAKFHLFSLYSSGGTDFYKSMYVYASFILVLFFGYLVIFSVPKDKGFFRTFGDIHQTIKCGVNKVIFLDIL